MLSPETKALIESEKQYSFVKGILAGIGIMFALFLILIIYIYI